MPEKEELETAIADIRISPRVREALWKRRRDGESCSDVIEASSARKK